MKRSAYPIPAHSAVAVCTGLFTLLSGCMPAEERATMRALQNGGRHFEAGRYADAARDFADAGTDAQAGYNAGVAFFRAGDTRHAAEQFLRASERGDTLQARALYDLGTTLAFQTVIGDSMAASQAEELGGIRIEGDDIARKVELLVLRDSLYREQHRLRALADSSLTAADRHLKQTLRLRPTDDRARYNLATVQALIAARQAQRDKDGSGKNDKDEQLELSVRAKLLVEQADKLVDEYKFKEALDLLQGSLQKEPSLKKEEEFMKKLDVVTKAAQAQ